MKKYITIIAAIVVLAGAFGISKSLKNRKKPAFPQRAKMMPLAYVQKVKNVDMPVIIPATGSLTAKNKIKLYSEVQGVLEYSDKEFKPGVNFNKGDLVYKLNSDEFATNLLAQKSSFQNIIASMLPDLRLDFKDSFEQWQQYLNELDIQKPLPKLPEPKTDTEKRFVAAKNVYNTYYNIKNLEIKLGKYAFYAPFNGVLTEANITPGTLVSPGQLIGEFVDPSVYEMEVTVSSSMVSKLKVGDQIEVYNLEQDSTFYLGRIKRINQKVDLNSQTVNVFIELKGDGLKEGLYLKAFLKSKVLENIVEIPRNLLVNQSQLYYVKDSALHLTTVEIVHQNEKTIVVRGLKDGLNIATKPVPEAFEGMKVKSIKDKS